MWKPIETAPTDGTSILVCRARDADGRIMKRESFGIFVQRVFRMGEDWIVYNSMIEDPRCFFNPSHWMEIPPFEEKGE